MPRVTTAADQLAAKAAVLRVHGIRDLLGFFHYGLMRLEALDRALAADVMTEAVLRLDGRTSSRRGSHSRRRFRRWRRLA
jgi:hypothetical protein